MSIEVTIIAVLSLIVGVVLVAYERLVRKLTKYEKEREVVEAESRQRAAKILENAQEKAMSILENTKIDAKGSQEEIDKKLTEITKKQVEYYKDMLQNISKNIKEDAQKVIEQQTTGAQNTVIQKIEDDYAAAKQEVDTYKQDRMRQIDTQAVEILKEFTKRAIGKVWSSQEHEEIIMEALEEAKKEYAI